MRLFKRRETDPSPRLVSLSPLRPNSHFSSEIPLSYASVSNHKSHIPKNATIAASHIRTFALPDPKCGIYTGKASSLSKASLHKTPTGTGIALSRSTKPSFIAKSPNMTRNVPILSEFKPAMLKESFNKINNSHLKENSKSRLRLPSTVVRETYSRPNNVLKSQSEGDLLKDFTNTKSKIPRSTTKINPIQKDVIRLNPKQSKGSYTFNKFYKGSEKIIEKGEKSSSKLGVVGELKVGNALQELKREKMEFEARKRKVSSTERGSKRINIILKTPKETKLECNPELDDHSSKCIVSEDAKHNLEKVLVSTSLCEDASDKCNEELEDKQCKSLEENASNSIIHNSENMAVKLEVSYVGKHCEENGIIDQPDNYENFTIDDDSENVEAIYASLDEMEQCSQDVVGSREIIRSSFMQKSKSTLTLDRDCPFDDDDLNQYSEIESPVLNTRTHRSTLDLSKESADKQPPSDILNSSIDLSTNSFNHLKSNRSHHLSTLSLSTLPSSLASSLFSSNLTSHFSQTFSPSFGHKFTSKFGSRFSVSKCPSVSSSTGVSWAKEMSCYDFDPRGELEHVRPASEDGNCSTPTARKKG